jgi:hypothetical protein
MTLAARDLPTLPPEALLRGGRSALAGNAEHSPRIAGGGR